jgi:hypothetical protein
MERSLDSVKVSGAGAAHGIIPMLPDFTIAVVMLIAVKEWIRIAVSFTTPL